MKNFCELHNLKRIVEEEKKIYQTIIRENNENLYFLTNANILFLYNIFGSVNRYLKKKFDTIFIKKTLTKW